MLQWLKSLFSGTTQASPIWSVVEKMDPLLSYARFQSLNLPPSQRPTVEGLIVGEVAPSDLEEVREWCETNNEDPAGIQALVFALQYVFDGDTTTYLFEGQTPVPAARVPNYVDEKSATILFSDRAAHLQITSVGDFARENGIDDYALVAIRPSDLDKEIKSRMYRFGGDTPKTEAGRARQGERISITIERIADAQERVIESVGADTIAEALLGEGHTVHPTEVVLEQPIEKLGLFNVIVQREQEEPQKVAVWVVPAVGSE